MRTINAPKNILQLDAVCCLDRTAAVGLWLATKSAGTVLDIGCRDGDRACSWAVMLLRFKRRIIALDWTREHRIHAKQRRPVTKFALGAKCRVHETVEVVDTDPGLFPVDSVQPLGFTLIDYDYSLDGLRRVTEPVLAAAPVLASPNVIVAWGGYTLGLQHPPIAYPNDVVNYVNSLDVSDTYHVHGSSVAFKVFNATPAFREELRGLSRL